MSRSQRSYHHHREPSNRDYYSRQPQQQTRQGIPPSSSGHHRQQAIVPYDFEGPGGQTVEYQTDPHMESRSRRYHSNSFGFGHPSSALSPFGAADPFALDSFFPRDPFQAMQQIMSHDDFMMPRGGLFDALDMVHPTSSTPHMMNFEGRPGGQFHSEVMVMSGTMGPDGRPQYKKFAQTTRGDVGQGIHEMQAAYEDSSEGLQRRALERQIGERGRKLVQERNTRTGEETRNDILRGMQDEETHQFDQQWQTAEASLPNMRFGAPRLLDRMGMPQQQHQMSSPSRRIPPSSSSRVEAIADRPAFSRQHPQHQRTQHAKTYPAPR